MILFHRAGVVAVLKARGECRSEKISSTLILGFLNLWNLLHTSDRIGRNRTGADCEEARDSLTSGVEPCVTRELFWPPRGPYQKVQRCAHRVCDSSAFHNAGNNVAFYSLYACSDYAMSGPSSVVTPDELSWRRACLILGIAYDRNLPWISAQTLFSKVAVVSSLYFTPVGHVV